MEKPSLHAYLGGSFDPVHQGHLQMACAVIDRLMRLQQAGGIKEAKLIFLPTAGNPFKDNQSAGVHRLAMLKLAVQSLVATVKQNTQMPAAVDIHIEDYELSRPPPSYSIDTMIALKARHAHAVPILVMGLDSLLALPTWKQGLKIVTLAHLWVFGRRQSNSSDAAADVAEMPWALARRITHDVNDLHKKSSGCIYWDERPILTISSTELRAALAQQSTGHVPPHGLPVSVWRYIVQHGLYVGK